eukprot:33738_1
MRRTVTLLIEGMTCNSQPDTIEKILYSVIGIHSVSISKLTKHAKVEFNETIIKTDEIIQEIEDLGFDVEIFCIHSNHMLNFLQSCVNFHTIKENALFLFYGYIRIQIKNEHLYKILPKDIIIFCISMCYNNINNIEQYEIDSFDAKTKYLLSHKNSIGIASKKSKYILGQNGITQKHIRKIWAIQVLSQTKNLHFQLKLAIIHKYEFQKLFDGTFFDDELSDDELSDDIYEYNVGFGSNYILKQNDVIYVLFINIGNGKGVIRFGINGNFQTKQFINLNLNFYVQSKYYLGVSMSECCCVKILNAKTIYVDK